MGPKNDLESTYLVAVEELVEAHVNFAETWTLARRRVNSDMAATQAAIEETGDSVTRAQARLKMMEIRLANG
jgi:hypothetical protein